MFCEMKTEYFLGCSGFCYNHWKGLFYPEEELKEWAEKIKKQNARRVFGYFNNDLSTNAVKNCQTLKQLLEKVR